MLLLILFSLVSTSLGAPTFNGANEDIDVFDPNTWHHDTAEDPNTWHHETAEDTNSWHHDIAEVHHQDDPADNRDIQNWGR